MYNKKGTVGTDKLIIAILVIAVLLLVFAFIFKIDILGLFKFLPSFNNSEDGNYNPPDEIKRSEAIIQCEKIGEVRAPEKIKWFQAKEQYIYFNNQRTNLYWGEDKIKIKTNNIFRDAIVGDISRNLETGFLTIKILSSFINNGEESPDYKKYKKDLDNVDINFLKNLDNSYLIPGNILCKKKDA